MSQLFSPVSLGELTLDNRIVIAPMCQYSAEAGNATAWHRIHLGQLAFSGAGLMIIEATAVEDIGRISPGDLGLWNDDNEAALKTVLEDVRRYSSIPIGMQLGHAGRKASCAVPWEGGKQIAPDAGGWQTVAPSAVSYSLWFWMPEIAGWDCEEIYNRICRAGACWRGTGFWLAIYKNGICQQCVLYRER